MHHTSAAMSADHEASSHLLDLEAVAQLLQVSERTIMRWIDDFGMPCQGDGDALRFVRDDVIEWADQHSFRLASAVPGEQDDQPLPSLADCVARGGVHYDVPGLDVEEALASVAQKLELPELVDRDFFHQVLLAREDLGSTGIGEGFAAPHVRAPLVLHVEHPVVGLFFLERPIDWSAIDGKPVETLFVVVSPAVRPHLHLLKRVAHALRHDATRHCLLERQPKEAVLGALRTLEAS